MLSHLVDLPLLVGVLHTCERENTHLLLRAHCRGCNFGWGRYGGGGLRGVVGVGLELAEWGRLSSGKVSFL